MVVANTGPRQQQVVVYLMQLLHKTTNLKDFKIKATSRKDINHKDSNTKVDNPKVDLHRAICHLT
jgi:hypothetical protein